MASPELKRAVLRLVAGILVVDAIFIAAWFFGDVAHRPDGQRGLFVALWTLATLAVVLPGLGGVRRIRQELRRGRRG